MHGNQNVAVIATLYNIANSGIITFDPNKVPLQYAITYPGVDLQEMPVFDSNLEDINFDREKLREQEKLEK